MVPAMMRPVGLSGAVGSAHVRSAVAPPRRSVPSSGPPSGPGRGAPSSPGGPGAARGPSTGSSDVATPGQPGPAATPGGFQQQTAPGQRQSGPAAGRVGGRSTYAGRGRGGRSTYAGRGGGRGGMGGGRGGPMTGGRGGTATTGGRGPMTGGRGPMTGGMAGGRGRGRGRFQPEERFDNKINMDIPYDEVRVLDKMKEMVGVMPLTQAMGLATASSMDVILINENAEPPLVRICSVSKYKYEIEKVKKEAQKKQRASQQELKELKLSPRTEIHDLEVRMRKAHHELSKGNKVKLLVAFKGREKESMIPIARKLIEQIFQHVEEVASYENRPMLQGRFLACTLMPKESKATMKK